MENKSFELTLDWEEVNLVDTDRVSAMFCFKHCDVNRS